MPAAYPVSLASFVTYYDQPPDPPGQPGQKTLVHPDGSTVDLTIDAAAITRQIQQEVVAIETVIGANPFQIPSIKGQPAGPKNPPAVPMQGYLSNSIHWLYVNLAWGSGTASVISATPAPSHNHMHNEGTALTADDHHQYMRVDGTRPFTRPVTSHAGTTSHSLATYSQVKGAGLTAAEMKAIVQDQLITGNIVHPPWEAGSVDEVWPGAEPMTGPAPQRYRMTGGYFYGPSDGEGYIYIDYSRAHFTGILTFVYMKMPFPGQSMLGYHNFQYMEDQLILWHVTNQGATIQFIEDIVVDRTAMVALSWIVMGV